MKRLVKAFDNPNYKNICILGFGREGKSTLSFLETLPPRNITISDKNPITIENPELLKNRVSIQTGDGYLDNLEDFDLIIKSPGVNLPDALKNRLKDKLSSQTALFLESFHQQIIGITGTKGKSTTSSLIHHILKETGRETLLVGNIGIPPFNLAHQIMPNSIIVCELSAQQLQDVKYSPHIALFLNLFSDHLDFFGDMERYGLAKYNILRFQDENDVFIYRSDSDFTQRIKRDFVVNAIAQIPVNEEESTHFECRDTFIFPKGKTHPVFDFSGSHLNGKHNFINTLFAIEAATCCGLSFQEIVPTLYSFHPLENRLEYVGNFNGKHFYNDSIATVPEAAIAAIGSIKNVQTIILGGYDRGIDFSLLIEMVAKSSVSNLIFTGPSGRRMLDLLNALFPNHEKRTFYFEHYENLVETAAAITPVDAACLLSPASPSYDSFKDFEDRGRFFKEKLRDFFS